jgi:hypothetical protein
LVLKVAQWRSGAEKVKESEENGNSKWAHASVLKFL